MKVFYDLHMHSILSPCGDDDMTPNNIANMSAIKGLDFIALTDHNGIQNVPALLSVAKALPITVVPGIEVQSKEDVHVVCLFKTYTILKKFYDDIVQYIPPARHNAKRFGVQQIMNDQDERIGTLTNSLYASVQLSIDDIIDKANDCGGGAILAHLDRKSYSMISNLGFIPPDLPIKTIEISAQCDKDKFLMTYAYLKNYQIIKNSDAHYLENISEPVNSIDLKEKSINALFDYLFD